MGNLQKLVSLCMNHSDVLLQMYAGQISVCVGEGPARTHWVTGCGNEEAIGRILLVLRGILS